MSVETRDVYLNPLQQETYYAGARDNRLEAARRFGLPDKEVDELIRNSDGVYETAPVEAEEERDIFLENEE